MKNLERFVFNSFGVNTYVLTDPSGQCIIVDPACQDINEERELSDFITAQQLTPVAMVNTHYHIDHIVGNAFVCGKYGLTPLCHVASKFLWEGAEIYGEAFGIRLNNTFIPATFLKEGDLLSFGSQSLTVLYTPGHADGSICLVNYDERYVISGDVLFRDSIGRTDLPSGNFDTLHESIMTKLFTLPDDYKVFPGHGPETTIGYEKLNNPFLF